MTFEIAVSVDGPTASGKTTLAYALARRCGALVLDTGLTFRGVAWALLRDSTLDPAHSPLPGRLSHEPAMPSATPNRPTVVFQQDEITELIWSPEVEARLRDIAADPAWRSCIAAYHRQLLAKFGRVVVVGRDVATTLLTNATCHVFLTAAHTVRRERRRAQYRQHPDRAATVGPASALDQQTLEAVARSPRGIVIDTTYLPPKATLTLVLRRIGADNAI
ncbi:MAG TPA: (d)CMP kinase [Candidatus Limnocylindrales bacterium]|nr:(d)CMP kinase [Candidatus Limnocylindrales bacterium]